MLGKLLRELRQAIQATSNGQKAELQEQLRVLKAQPQAHEQAAKSAQAEDDLLYSPIYNLDLLRPINSFGI